MSFTRRGHAGAGYGYVPDRRHAWGVPVREASHLYALPVPTQDGGLDEAAVRQMGILDQGAAPYCVGNGWAAALRDCQQRNGVAAPRLASRLWLMFGAHAIEGDISGFDGAMVGDAAEWIEKVGFPTEDVLPYTDTNPNPAMTAPPADAYRQAFDRKEPLSYSRIMESGQARVDAVLRALAWGGQTGRPCPIVFGTDVSNAFASNRLPPGYVVDTPAYADIDGGHCMEIIRFAFDPGVPGGVKFRVKNSWGPDFGDGGFFWMTPAYLMSPATADIWLVDYQGVLP